MGNSTRTKGGKAASVPISMHPSKGGYKGTVGGMAGKGGKKGK